MSKFKRYVWLMISVLFLVGSIFKYNQILKLEDNGYIQTETIVKKICRNKSSSILVVNFKSKAYYIPCNRNKCDVINIGENIELIYVESGDSFHISGTANEYKIFIYIALVFAFLAFLPWNKLRKSFN